jgi:hypothetical protein
MDERDMEEKGKRGVGDRNTIFFFWNHFHLKCTANCSKIYLKKLYFMNHDGCEKTVAKQPLRMLAAEILQLALNFSLLLSPLVKWYNGLFARTKVKETL